MIDDKDDSVTFLILLFTSFLNIIVYITALHKYIKVVCLSVALLNFKEFIYRSNCSLVFSLFGGVIDLCSCQWLCFVTCVFNICLFFLFITIWKTILSLVSSSWCIELITQLAGRNNCLALFNDLIKNTQFAIEIATNAELIMRLAGCDNRLVFFDNLI